MILQTVVAGTVFAALASAAAADCSSETDFVTGRFQQTGYSVVEAGEPFESDGRCRLAGLVLRENVIQLDIEEIAWALTGLEALESGDGEVVLDVDLENLRFAPQTSDPWFSYMMQQQNRRNLIDGRLNASWNLGDGVFSVSELMIDLPGKNSFSLTSRTEGMSPDLLTGAMGVLAGVSLGEFDLMIENHGFLDGAILGYVVGQFSGTPGPPEAVVEGTKKELLAIVAGLPEAAFPAASKGALVTLIDAGPVPWGKLKVSVVTDAPISLARLPGMGIVTGSAEPMSLEDALAGAHVDIRFDASESIE
ncbi:MAG: hypothetical protein ACR2OY_08250 [Boseongicola sp.]